MRYRSKGLRRRRDTDKWELRLVHDDPLTGEEVLTYHTVDGKTRKQAEVARDQLIVDLEMQGYAVSSDITVRRYLADYLSYKESIKAIESSTVSGYKHDVTRINKYIGAERISDLTIAMVSKCLADMIEDGYHPKTVVKSFMLLKQALNHAVGEELILRNPCNFVKPPKRVKPKINALSREDRSRLLKLARDAQPTPLAVAIEIALTTGMRRGEICALRWSDYDPLRGTLSVNHALGHGDGGYYLKEPKSPDSVRTIPITMHLRGVLDSLIEDAKYMCKRLKLSFNGDAYILGSQERDSRPYNPTQIGKDFACFCKMNNFDCTLHDLRHTFATYMIGCGVDVRTVASYLGHANPSMTLDIYADVDPDAKAMAVLKIPECFDDPVSVLECEHQHRKMDMRAKMLDPTSDKSLLISNLTPETIPFTYDELERMMGMLRSAKAA